MAIDFEATSSEKTILGADTTITTAKNNISFGAWINVETWGSGDTIINNGYGGGSGRGYMLQLIVSGGNNRVRIDISFVGAVTSTTNLSTGTWYHVMGTRGTTTWNIYVNGTSEATNTYNPYDISGEAETVIGARKTDSGGYDSFFDGIIAEAAFWTRELSAGEVASLADGYSPLFYPRGLVFYHPMIRSATQDYIDSRVWTATGTTVVAHPRIIYPSSGFMRKFTTAVSAVAELAAYKSLLGVGL